MLISETRHIETSYTIMTEKEDCAVWVKTVRDESYDRHAEGSEFARFVSFKNSRNHTIVEWNTLDAETRLTSHLIYKFIHEDPDMLEDEYLMSLLDSSRYSTTKGFLESAEKITNGLKLSAQRIKQAYNEALDVPTLIYVEGATYLGSHEIERLMMLIAQKTTHLDKVLIIDIHHYHHRKLLKIAKMCKLSFKIEDYPIYEDKELSFTPSRSEHRKCAPKKVLKLANTSLAAIATLDHLRKN